MTSAQLKKLGISQQLISRYIESKWLKAIGRGVFVKVGDQIDWTAALFTLQTELGLSVHVGGKTALDFYGIHHYTYLLGEGLVWLFGKKGEKLPIWFINGSEWNNSYSKIQYTIPRLFDDETTGLESIPIGRTRIVTDAFDTFIDTAANPNPMDKKNLNDYEIIVSSVERAILEILYLIPSQQTLEQAKYLMEGLMTLRPALIQQLLEQCRSIKTKRLFIFLAELCHLPCLEHLDSAKINLGKGKRVIGVGGSYIAKHKISVPESFANTFAEELEQYE